jgi:4-hydroxy-3-methylbut-2-enyl diphosphate reductase
MKVIRAGVMGFCMGVRRAVELAFAKPDGMRTFSYGQLVHNPKALADLQKCRIETVDNPSEISEGCCVIICAHGISPSAEKELRKKRAQIVDATCPIVKASQLQAERLSRGKYCIFLAGKANHPEIDGILGYAQVYDRPFCAVVGNASEAGKTAKKLYGINHDAKTALLGQTTISEKEYLLIGEAIKLFFPNLEIIQTICSATTERQQALREILDQVDAVIIAGGKESSNTRRLLAIAESSGKSCVLVEDANEIPVSFFNYEKVGLSAGASTPDSVIDEVEQKLMCYQP